MAPGRFDFDQVKVAAGNNTRQIIVARLPPTIYRSDAFVE
jgi:hypothetical protein